MQVQTISNSQQNSQHFQGGVAIVGDLSAMPSSYVRKAAPQLKKILADKPFDLFIRENYEKDTISLIAQKARHFGKKNKPVIEYTVDKMPRYNKNSSNEDMYLTVAKMAVDDYEKLNQPMTFGDRLNVLFRKIGQKFMDIVQDKDEI